MKRRSFFAALAALPFVGKLVKPVRSMAGPRFWVPIPPGMTFPPDDQCVSPPSRAFPDVIEYASRQPEIISVNPRAMMAWEKWT